MRAISVAKKLKQQRQQQQQQEQQQEHDSLQASSHDTLSQPQPSSSPPTTSLSQLKRQLFAHLIDFPLAARSAGIQASPPSHTLRWLTPSQRSLQPFVSLLDDQSAGILGIVSSVLLWTISPA